MPPLPSKFAAGSTMLGHYSIGHVSGTLAATIGAMTTTTGANALSRLLFPSNSYGAKLVLCRLSVGQTIIGAVTTAVQTAFMASIARSVSVDFSTAITNTSMLLKNGAMDSAFSNSQMGATGPGIATTAVMSGQTLIGDASPFALASAPNPSPTLGASAVTNQVGTGTEMIDLYNWQTQGGHPPTLSGGQAILVGLNKAGPGDGTWAFYTRWEWCEVINPFGNG